MTDGIYNAAERIHVRQAARAAKVADREQKHFIANIMATAAGRAWIFDILTRCHLYATAHSDSALWNSYHLGERNIGNMIVAQLMAACPDQYILAMREANARDSTADARRRQATSPNPDWGDSEPRSDDSPDSDAAYVNPYDYPGDEAG